MVLNPEITNVDSIDTSLHLTVQNVDVSVINALRRTILSNIPTLVFRGFPNNKNNIEIRKNTTKFNNEYLKQRISCIPVFNDNPSTFKSFIENYVVELNKINETMSKMYVTTEHFKLKNKNTGQYLPDQEVKKYFPPDPITGDYLMIVVLYPNFNSKNEPNEEISFEAKLDIGTAQENSCWNIVHNVCYENVQDPEKVKQHSDEITDEYEKKDFLLLDAQRLFIPNKFRMTIDSLGIYENQNILLMACDIIVKKLSKIEHYINQSSPILTKDEYDFNATNGMASQKEIETNMNKYCDLYKEDDFVVFKLFEDDFTIGKIVEKYLFYMFEKDLSYIGFKKDHPTKKEAFIYIKFKQESSTEKIHEYFKQMLDATSKIFTKIRGLQQ